MTGCLYISPPSPFGQEDLVVPYVFADTLVSYLGQSHLDPITPGTVNVNNFGKESSVSLQRKLHIIENTAVAVAGSGYHIRTFLKDLKYKLPEFEKLDRPAREIGKIANNVNDYYGNIVLEVVSCTERNEKFSYTTAFERMKSRHLGIYGAVGSGKEELEKQCEITDRQLDAWDPRLPIGDKIAGFAARLQGARLAAEMEGDLVNGWGGYVEYAYWRNGWHRGPKTLHLFLYCDLLHSPGSIDLISRCVAYDPGDEKCGHVIVIKDDIIATFTLTSLLIEQAKTEMDDRPHWVGWEPEWVAVTCIFYRADNRRTYTTISIDPWDMKSVSVSISMERIAVNIDPEFLSIIKSRLSEHIAKSDRNAYQSIFFSRHKSGGKRSRRRSNS